MKSKNLYIVLLISFGIKTFSQIKLTEYGEDKDKNTYVCGTFDNTINLGNETYLKDEGGENVFVAKYDPKGICVWAIKIKAKDVRGMYVESNGNFYLSGICGQQAKFGLIKLTNNSTDNFYITKYNTSGDPIWVKTSKSKTTSYGNGITADKSGNLYVIGDFEGQFMFDNQTLISKGNKDFFIMKLSQGGICAWIKNYGDADYNTASSIYYDKNKLLVTSSTIMGEGYTSSLHCLSADGSVSWDKKIGTTKGGLNTAKTDNIGNVIATGLIESNDNDANKSFLYVGKFSLDNGAEIWTKKYNANRAEGNDIACDEENNIYITGSFSDSLRMEKFFKYGLQFEDVFIAKLNASGKTQWLKQFGNNTYDYGRKLIIQKKELIFLGEFSSGIEFNKTFYLSGGKNTIFIANYDLTKNDFTKAKVLVKEELNPQDNAKYSDICGKLLKGSGPNKEYLNDQFLHIEDNEGNLVKSTTTDENGDFSFKNLDITTTFNLKVHQSDKIKESDEIYLAQQNGIIVNKLEKSKDNLFQYRLLPATMSKLIPIEEEEDFSLKMKDFKKSSDENLTLIQRINYAANAFKIPIDGEVSLNQIALFLRQNPKMKIEITAHTDTNGDEVSNMELSKKRAEAVKNYFVQKHIGIERITVVGMGESQIINRCANGVKCTDTEHSYNRRTEFKFIKVSGF